MSIHHHGGIRILPRENEIDGLSRLAQLRLGQARLAIDGREAGRLEQNILLAQRNLKRRRETHHHLARGTRPPALHEAEMARRDVGVQAERELTEAAPAPPGLEQNTESRLRLRA